MNVNIKENQTNNVYYLKECVKYLMDVFRRPSTMKQYNKINNEINNEIKLFVLILQF